MTMRSELEAARTFVLCHVPAESRVLCAVSGGLDSMCLLHFMNTWGQMGKFPVMAAHFNHRLRPTADRDEAFVRRYCETEKIPFVSGSGDVRALADREGLSLEEAARKLRYAFLRETAEREGCAVILTAHHADDNAETMLLNLVRGTGVKGLTGIPADRDGVLRPFLEITRTDLETYAAAHDIPHVEDETNADPDAAARNLLRLKVMPLLKQLNPHAVEHLNETARQLCVIDRSLDMEAEQRTAHAEARKGRVTLSRQALHEAPPSVRPRMLLRLFDLLGVGRKDIGAVHLNAILDLTDYDAGKERRLALPHGVTARFFRGWLVLETRPQPLTEVQLLPGQPLGWGDYTLTLLDHRVGEGLAIRRRRETENGTVTAAPCVPGERLTLPSTNGGSRSVKRLCVDRGVSLTERDHLPAIYADGRLAAVWRLGVDTEFLPEGEPCRFIQITKRNAEEKDHGQ